MGIVLILFSQKVIALVKITYDFEPFFERFAFSRKLISHIGADLGFPRGEGFSRNIRKFLTRF